jgi:hypothetical protein
LQAFLSNKTYSTLKAFTGLLTAALPQAEGLFALALRI